MTPPTAFLLVGPTASGKSAVAQCLAEREGRTVVSADSMNVYRGMDVGTAKPSAKERGHVSYAGIDLVAPSEKFSVAAWLNAVAPVLRGARPEPVVAGGTGLYVKCLLDGLSDVPPENAALRTELEALSLPELERRALRDAAAAFEALPPSDRRNPRRLVRILEKARAGGGETKNWRTPHRLPHVVGLRLPRDLLWRRIETRVERMYAGGLLDEAAELLRNELSPTAGQAIGYAEAFSVLRGERSPEEAKQHTVVRTRRLAKRQLTWFRNQLRVEWIEVDESDDTETLAAAVAETWRRIGPSPLRLPPSPRRADPESNAPETNE